MRIAVPYEDGQVFQHFGHTSQVKLYDIEDERIAREQIAGIGSRGHGALAGFLGEQKVDILICGGIGGGAQNALAQAYISLYGGVTGSADEAVKAFLAGCLNYNPDAAPETGASAANKRRSQILNIPILFRVPAPAGCGDHKGIFALRNTKTNWEHNARRNIKMEQKFYICEHCGNIVAMVKNAGVPVMCCGQKMTEIVPGTTDAAVEKHIPVYQVEGNLVKVRVGSVEHPMLPEHYIEWVSLQTRQGNQRKALHPGDKPEVCFALCEGDQVEAVYAYCNLHSLWKA